jgi:hypothetical protein
MFQKYGRSTDLGTLARLAWAGGLGDWFGGSDAATFLAAYKARFGPATTYAWWYRGLALVCLRAGDFAGVEAALGKVGRDPLPVDDVIRGLVAARRGDLVAARACLAKAEEAVAGWRPTEANPFPHAGRNWNQHTELMILLAELRGAVAPPVAPAPRPKEPKEPKG